MTIKYYNSIIGTILFPVKKNIIFFVMMYLLGMITTFIQVIELSFDIPIINFFTWIFDLYLICIILTIVPQNIRKGLVCFFSFFLYSLAIIDAFCIENFQAKLGSEIINLVLETNKREASEFAGKYITSNIFFSTVTIIIALAVLHIAIAIKTIRLEKHTNRLWSNKTVRYISVLVISISICISLPSRIGLVMFMFSKDAITADTHISNHIFNTPFNNLLFSIKMRQLSNTELNEMIDYQRRVEVKKCDYTSANIVLIIGESYIKSHSQLYGYTKETTPKQIKHLQDKQNGHMTVFSDVVSPSNLTSIVFKNVFSLRSIDSPTSWKQYTLFPVLFKKAGYHISFISNQFVKSVDRDIFNVSGGLFLNNSQLERLQFDHRNTQAHRYDGDLLEDYDSLKRYNTASNLLIFHLAGQHIDFFKRCPDKYRKFQRSDYENRKDLNDEEQQLVADYDNATLYNDIVVDAIISQFEDEEAIIIYMPDHGEECFDDIHRMGRMPQNSYSSLMVKNEFEIPFWIWCSNRYCHKHPEIINLISSAKDRPFMTDDLPHLLLFLAGIHHKDYDETKNLISPLYNPKRARMLDGTVDYDKIKPQSHTH